MRKQDEYIENITEIFLSNLNSLRRMKNIDVDDITFDEKDQDALKVALCSTIDGMCKAIAEDNDENYELDEVTLILPTSKKF